MITLSKKNVSVFVWLLIGVAIVVFFSRADKPVKPLSPEQQAQLDCEMKIYDERNKQSIANLERLDVTTFSVREVIHARRLEEKFCIQLANCGQRGGDSAADEFARAVSVDDCLTESYKERLIDTWELRRAD